MKIKNAFALATPPTNANGLDVFAFNANKKLVDCLDWLEYSFPLSYRRKELRGEALNPYYSPMCYLKSREWFRLEPDDTVKAFSFFYANSTRTSLTSSAYTQTLNFVVFANTERIFAEDNIYTETLINQALSVFRDSYFFDTIPLTNTLTVFEDFDDAWQDFDFPEVNKQRFLKENYSTFRIQFDVVYNVIDCLSCLEPVPPTPEPTQDYLLNLTQVARDSLILGRGSDLHVIPSTGDWYAEIKCDISGDLTSNGFTTFFGHIWGGSVFSFDRYACRMQNSTNLLFFALSAVGGSGNVCTLDISTLDFSDLTIRFGYKNGGTFLSANGLEATGLDFRPTNEGNVTGISVNGIFLRSGNLVNNQVILGQENIKVYHVDINGDKWDLNEGEGFEVVSNNGVIGEGYTESPDALTYWNENVWQEIL